MWKNNNLKIENCELSKIWMHKSFNFLKGRYEKSVAGFFFEKIESMYKKK
jgi:hypothetical protein